MICGLVILPLNLQYDQMSQKKKGAANAPQTLKPTSSKVSTAAPSPEVKATVKAVSSAELVFGKENYKWMLIGFGVMVLGFILMSGGSMPDPNTWDPDIIYSFRRITLAPFLILAGIVIEIYAIFITKKQAAA